IEVVFALPAQQVIKVVKVTAGSCVDDAIDQSGISALFPDVDLGVLTTGVWGHPAERSQVLRDGDRVEVYRALLMDPREARRQLAEHGGAMGQKSTGR
ncbi:MAG: RnfH family protein, partial [Woeseia sp.]